MFIARIVRNHAFRVDLGPTDTRDEASRLARAWMEVHPPQGGTIGEVREVRIERVEEAEAED